MHELSIPPPDRRPIDDVQINIDYFAAAGMRSFMEVLISIENCEEASTVEVKKKWREIGFDFDQIIQRL